MTLKVTQGHRNCLHSLGHIWPIYAEGAEEVGCGEGVSLLASPHRGGVGEGTVLFPQNIFFDF